MYKEIHGFTVVAHEMKENNIERLCNKILGVGFDLFRKGKFGNILTLTHAFGDAKESVHIKHNANGGAGYTSINLHGSFFDHAPDFDLSRLIRYLSKFEYTPKQLDIAFVDNDKHLTKKELRHWCRFSGEYCTGGLIAKRAPEIVYCDRKLSRIHLGSPRSTINYGTIYVRPDTGFVRIEIKVKDKDKIQYLLESYAGADNKRFDSKCLELLVSCIDFVTAASKKCRVSKKYKRQPSWKSFLGSDIQKVNWSRVKEKKRARREISDRRALDKSISRNRATIENMVERYKGVYSEEEIMKVFSKNSVYKLVKVGSRERLK